MAHLELKQIVHRDLAARNVLGTCCDVNVTEDFLIFIVHFIVIF